MKVLEFFMESEYTVPPGQSPEQFRPFFTRLSVLALSWTEATGENRKRISQHDKLAILDGTAKYLKPRGLRRSITVHASVGTDSGEIDFEQGGTKIELVINRFSALPQRRLWRLQNNGWNIDESEKDIFGGISWAFFDAALSWAEAQNSFRAPYPLNKPPAKAGS